VTKFFHQLGWLNGCNVAGSGMYLTDFYGLVLAEIQCMGTGGGRVYLNGSDNIKTGFLKP
jgi:hypothetical protein